MGNHFLENSPPRRSLDQLMQWVEDFKAQGHLIAGDLHVAEQDDSDDQDTGLVIVRLRGKAVSVYMQPVAYDDPTWQITMTAREDEVTLSPEGLASLAAELVVAGNLCTYLQWRSLEWDRDSGRHSSTVGSS